MSSTKSKTEEVRTLETTCMAIELFNYRLRDAKKRKRMRLLQKRRRKRYNKFKCVTSSNKAFYNFQMDIIKKSAFHSCPVLNLPDIAGVVSGGGSCVS